MDPVYLITLADIQAVKPISGNSDVNKKLNPFILEAQEFDLMKFLGDEFYIALEEDFAAQPSLETYANLFNGCEYEYAGKTYRHGGIKKMLIYFAYARYKANAQSNDTAFGTVVKTTPDSTPVSEKTIARQVDQALAGAYKYQSDVNEYLCRMSSDYPLWSGRVADREQRSSLRISAVGGNKTKLGSSTCCRGCGRYSRCTCNL